MRTLPTVLVYATTTILLGCDDDIEPEESSLASALSLTNSNFEIDTNANLKRDGASPLIDWATVADTKRNDLTSGTNDNSYSGGAKEDEPCPGVGTGSIPNNKSDLLTFGVFQEPGPAGHPGFLHVFWTRVQEPSGTTLMDFEFNQSSTLCGNGVNPVRTAGDFLLEYRIEQGGAAATIKIREWTGTVWGEAADVTTTGQAIGTINSTTIPAADSDGLISTGSISARTFGEASLDLSVIFDSERCQSFGSAFVKSRASDAFTSQLKDFIAPTPINITNCGKVIIRKQTIPDGDTTEFTFNHTVDTDPTNTGTFTLADGESEEITSVLFGSDYTVTETVANGYSLTDIDCSASTGVTVETDLASGTVTFDIDDENDIVDCTYTNTRNAGAIVISKTRKHAASGPGDHPHAFVEFQISGGDLVMPVSVYTDANGEACLGGLGLSGAVGDYTVTEIVPTGYKAATESQTVSVTANATCPDGDEVSFSNTPLTNLTVSVDSQVEGGTASTITCGTSEVTTDADGDGALTLEDLEPGTYTCTIVIDP